METTVQQYADTTLIAVKGRVDHKSAKDFEDALTSQLAPTGAESPPILVLDLADLEYMTSAGLRVLMIAAKTCAGQQRKLAVAALQPLIAEIFKISRFDLVLQIYPTVADALDALSTEAAALWRK
jgi:anti-sigma B factor antagonist/stage II sporulation protein AA (anti-sigma F factor antagonist)